MGKITRDTPTEGCILALDVGTSSLHCLLADPLGSPIASKSAPLRYFTPEGCPTTAREFNPEEVLSALGRLIGPLLRGQGIRPGSISAIGITGQRQGVVFLDSDGKELYCGPNIDLRAIFEGAAIDEEMGREVYAATGHTPSMLMAPARLRWSRENRPAIYEKTRTVLTIPAWLAYRLTGALMSEPSLEGEAGLLDINTGRRCPGLLDRLGVSQSLLPPLPITGRPCAGSLSRSMADLWGLKEGIPVVVAGPDTQCGMLGMGLVKAGQTGAVIGWSGALQVITSTPCLDKGLDDDMNDPPRTWAGLYTLPRPEGSGGGTTHTTAGGNSLPHPSGWGIRADTQAAGSAFMPHPGGCGGDKALWVAESSLGDSGNAYRWLKDTLLGRDASFDEADRMARQTPADPEQVMSFLGPGPVSPFRSGLRMGGLLFPTPLSFQETSPGQMFLAALENIAYSARAGLDTLGEVTGLKIDTLSLGGGMSRSRAFPCALAATLGYPVRRSLDSNVSARGAALAAAMYKDSSFTLSQAAELASGSNEEIGPGTPSRIAQYQESYHQWLNMYKRLGGK